MISTEVSSFGRALREAGARVSLVEVQDACAALSLMDCTDAEIFRLALRCCLVKESKDQEIFDALFPGFFHFARPSRRGREPGQRRGPGSGDQPGAGSPRGMGEPRRGQPPQEGAGRTPTREREEGARKRRSESAGAEVGRWEEERRKKGRESLGDERRSLREEMARRGAASLEIRRPLSLAEARLAEAEVERMIRRLATRESLRLRRSLRGRVDLKGTVARSVRTGGVPFALVRRSRRITKPRLLLLVDVSGSMRQAAALLLRLVAGIEGRFASTQTLAFVDRPVEVSGLLGHLPLERAALELGRQEGLNLGGLSDYGGTFYRLQEAWLPLLRPDTVLLILGDGRTNHFDPMVWAFKEIRSRVRRIVWLNPDPRRQWGEGDSAIFGYLPLIDDHLPCATLEDLARATTCL